MKHVLKLICALLASALWAVAATAQNPSGTAPGMAAPPSASCTTCGVVQSIRYVEKKGEGSGAGLVAGGIVGGVLGHQIGSGRGNTAATIVGAGTIMRVRMNNTISSKTARVGDTFTRAAGFLRMAVARATSVTDAAVDTVS